MAVDAKTGSTLRGMTWVVKDTKTGKVVATPNVQSGRWRHRLPAGDLTLEGTWNEQKYIPISEKITLKANEDDFYYFASTTKLKRNVGRIVMVWNDRPKDLDGILTTPVCELDYQSSEKCKDTSVKLEKDDVDGRGPETITIKRWENGKYIYRVKQHTNDGLLRDSNARVYFYTVAGAQYEFRVGRDGVMKDKWWAVFSIDTKSNTIAACTTLDCK